MSSLYRPFVYNFYQPAVADTLPASLQADKDVNPGRVKVALLPANPATSLDHRFEHIWQFNLKTDLFARSGNYK